MDPGSIIKILGGEFVRYGGKEEMKFEVERGVKFPSFPTSDEIPVLKLVEELGRGATGIVYKAVLLHPDICDDAPSYAVKLVDSGWRNPKEDRNVVEDLHKEYVNYCVLELGKRYPDLENPIMRSTATCYGLYCLRDPLTLWPKFVLITEHCDTKPAESYTVLEHHDKCVDHVSHLAQRRRDFEGMDRPAVMDSLIHLHTLGLRHNDTAKRNVVFDSKTKTYKFIDLCTSSWHLCPGIPKCDELKRMLHKLNLSPDYQTDEKQAKRNIRLLLESTKELDTQKLATNVSQLAEKLNMDRKDSVKRHGRDVC